VAKWLKKYADIVAGKLKSDAEKASKAAVPIIELDELWTFVKKNPNKSGYGLRRDRERGQIIDFEIGDGSTSTFVTMYRRLKKRYVAQIFCSDANPVYKNVLSAEKHVCSKAETCLVESLNASFRDMIASLNRKTKRYAKSLKTLYCSVFLHIHRKILQSI
jgi:IS1 family transposase